MNENKEKKSISNIAIFIAVAYGVGFISWNFYLIDFGIFEYQLLQTRYISAGSLFLLPPLVLFYILSPKLKKSIGDLMMPYSSKSRMLVVFCCSLYLIIFIYLIFPSMPQYFGGSKPIPVSIIAESDVIKRWSDFGIDGADNAGKPSRQTQSLCAFYQNSDFVIVGIPKVENNFIYLSRVLTLNKDQIQGFDVADPRACPPSLLKK